MLSRVACNMYWATRYLERVENTARLINVHSHLLLDLPRDKRSLGWEPLLAISGIDDPFFQNYRSPSEANVVAFLLSDAANPSSVLSSINRARDNLRSTRDIIPREAWEELNDLYLSAKQRLADGVSRRVRYDFLKSVIRHCQLITGLFHGTMSHDTAYNFMRVGRYLERADMSSRILNIGSAELLKTPPELELSPLENIQWMSVLKSLTGYQMYRQHIRLRVNGADVIRFLLLDEAFPRSVFHCLTQAGHCLQNLPHNRSPRGRLLRLRRETAATDIDSLVADGLTEFIDRLQLGLAGVHDAIDASYFTPHAQKPPSAAA